MFTQPTVVFSDDKTRCHLSHLSGPLASVFIILKVGIDIERIFRFDPPCEVRWWAGCVPTTNLSIEQSLVSVVSVSGANSRSG